MLEEVIVVMEVLKLLLLHTRLIPFLVLEFRSSALLLPLIRFGSVLGLEDTAFLMVIIRDISIGLSDLCEFLMSSCILVVEIGVVQLGQFVVLSLDVHQLAGGFQPQDGEVGSQGEGSQQAQLKH